MAVYFIRVGAAGPVKIGVADDVDGRRAELQTGNHVELIVIRAIPGARPEERWLHQKFAASRIRGEWFEYDKAMLTVIPDAIHTIAPVTAPPPTRTAALFLSSIESFLASSGMSATQFGREAMGDPQFVFDLRAGRDCSSRVVDRALTWIETQREAA